MDKKQARELVDKYLAGDCTPEEKLLVESSYYDELLSRKHLAAGDFDHIKNEIWTGMQQGLQPAATAPVYIRWLAVAASLILIAGAGIWFFQQKPEPALTKPVVYQKKTLEPASQRAMLTLSDGSKITLDDAAQGEISRQAGQKIVKLSNGKIAYSRDGDQPVEDKLLYNTLSTPRAAYYHLSLTDGSQVWLNAESSITYPAAFAANDRTVSITGEVYFEIAKDVNKPFLVKTGQQIIRVLGTHFNVMAYNDAPRILTTLLEGSVQLNHKNQQAVLKPGFQAAVDRDASGFDIRQVNTANAIAWKEGYFKFDNEPLTDIMKKLARWYDVEISFKDDIGQRKFWGTYSRTKSLDNLLNGLQQTEDVHFKIDGKNITVLK